MGASVSTLTEVKDGYGDWSIKSTTPFQSQNYAVFAFLAGVRNCFMLTPISFQLGLPDGHESVETIVNLLGDKGFVSRYPDSLLDGQFHVHVYLRELVKFNYDQQFEDLRNYGPGFEDCVEPGKGVMTTYRELLGQRYFDDLESLKNIGEPPDVRIILAFDSVI